jgi:peptide/nickel transport system ATP-binding protein
MRQRAMIAMAVINRPDLIIADEPTTALDVTVQAQILDTLVGITGEAGVAMMRITHDLGVVAGVADRVQVMYGGAVVEAAGVDELFAHPRMPYTVGLLGSVPHPEQVGARLTPIAGAPPSPLHLPPGCAFGPRCPLVQQRCTAAEPDLLPVTVPGGGPGSGHPGTPRTADGAAEHLARCVRWSELPGDRAARTLFEHAEIGSPLNAEPVGREGQR